MTWSMLDLGFLSARGECDVEIKLLVKGGHSPRCPYREGGISLFHTGTTQTGSTKFARHSPQRNPRTFKIGKYQQLLTAIIITQIAEDRLQRVLFHHEGHPAPVQLLPACQHYLSCVLSQFSPGQACLFSLHSLAPSIV